MCLPLSRISLQTKSRSNLCFGTGKVVVLVTCALAAYAAQSRREQAQPGLQRHKKRSIRLECSGTCHNRPSSSFLLCQHLLSSGLYRRRRNSSAEKRSSPSPASLPCSSSTRGLAIMWRWLTADRELGVVLPHPAPKVNILFYFYHSEADSRRQVGRGTVMGVTSVLSFGAPARPAPAARRRRALCAVLRWGGRLPPAR